MASTQFTDGSLVTPSMTNVPGDRGLTFRAFRRDFPDDITLVVHPLADGGPRPGRSINHFKFQLVLHDASPSVFSEPYLSTHPRSFSLLAAPSRPSPLHAVIGASMRYA